MSTLYSNIIINFHDSETAERFWNAILDIDSEEYKKADEKFKEMGIKTRFTISKPYLEYRNIFDKSVSLQAGTGASHRLFTPAAMKSFAGARLIFIDEYSDQDGSGSTKLIYDGKVVKKNLLSGILSKLTPQEALFLSIQLGHESAKDIVQTIPDLNQYYLGCPMFWHLIPYSGPGGISTDYIRNADVSLENDRGETALHYATRYSSDRKVGMLIRFGCDINKQNIDGQTPLMLACQKTGFRNSDIANSILKYKPDTHLRDKDGLAAIHYASFNAHGGEIIKLLISHGIDINTPSPKGSPLWICNATNRGFARQYLWSLDAVLRLSNNAYDRDPFENIKTALCHRDIKEFKNLLGSTEIEKVDATMLLAIACEYQDGDSFFELVKRYKLKPAASDVVNDKSLVDRLNFLYPQHPTSGDSLAIGLELLKNDSKEGVTKLIDSRDFIINLKRLIYWNPNMSIEYFSVISDLGFDIGSIDFTTSLSLLHGLTSDLDEDKKTVNGYYTLEELFNSLLALRRLGIVFSKYDIKEIKECGFDDERLALLE